MSGGTVTIFKPSVFIVYAHDGHELNESVVRLKSKLQERRKPDEEPRQFCSVVTDHDFNSNEDWYAWMKRSFQQADKVLVVCTPRLKSVFDNSASRSPEPPSGVAFEVRMIKKYLRCCKPYNAKIIPIMPDLGNEADSVPEELLPYWDNKLKFPGGYEEILKAVLTPVPYLLPLRIRRQQLWRWCRDYPGQAIFTGLGALLLTAVAAMLFAAFYFHDERIIDTAAKYNSVLAVAHARVVLSALRDSASGLKRCARELELVIQDDLLKKEPAYPTPAFKPCVDELDFDVMFLESTGGYMHARWPAPLDPSIKGVSFKFRNYFTCAFELQIRQSREVCISKAYVGDHRGNGYKLQYSISVPVYDSSGNWIGVLAAQRSVASRLEDIQTIDAYGNGQVTSLLGPTDVLPDRLARTTPAEVCQLLRPDAGADNADIDHYSDKPTKSDLAVVIHEQAQSDQLCRIDSKLSVELQHAFRRSEAPEHYFETSTAAPVQSHDYVEPISGDVGAAGFAPVGYTGYIVVVYTPKAMVLAISDEQRKMLLIAFLLLILASSLVTGVRVYATVASDRI